MKLKYRIKDMKITITEKESELLMSLLNEQRNYDCHKLFLKISEKYDRLQVAKINSPKQNENMIYTGNNTCNHCGKIVDYINYKHHLYMYCINKTDNLYLIPKGENGLPLHPISDVSKCMKSYEKKIGICLTMEEFKQVLIEYSELISINDCSFSTQEERENCVNRFINGEL